MRFKGQSPASAFPSGRVLTILKETLCAIFSTMSEENTLRQEVLELYDTISSRSIEEHLTKIITAYVEVNPPKNPIELSDDVNKQIVLINFFHRLALRIKYPEKT